MKVFDSGMPDEEYWNSLFDISLIVDWLDLEVVRDPIVEIGCGYGTFTIPVAREAKAEVQAFDIDQAMIETARRNAARADIHNAYFNLRDVVEDGTGLEPESSGMVLLFNILHFEGRRDLLDEASRILKPRGVVAIIHWRKDIPTPRGPRVESRPDKEMIMDSIRNLGLSFDGNSRIIEPYHWGMQLIKSSNNSKEIK